MGNRRHEARQLSTVSVTAREALLVGVAARFAYVGMVAGARNPSTLSRTAGEEVLEGVRPLQTSTDCGQAATKEEREVTTHIGDPHKWDRVGQRRREPTHGCL